MFGDFKKLRSPSLRVSFCLAHSLIYNHITKACTMTASSEATLGTRWSKLAVCVCVCVGVCIVMKEEKCTQQTHRGTVSLHFLVVSALESRQFREMSLLCAGGSFCSALSSSAWRKTRCVHTQ